LKKPDNNSYSGSYNYNIHYSNLVFAAEEQASELAHAVHKTVQETAEKNPHLSHNPKDSNHHPTRHQYYKSQKAYPQKNMR
jgi:hypothetical protein